MKIKNKKYGITVSKLVLSSMFLAIGFVLPSITGQVQLIGNMLLPMHIPVLLCGLICGWQYGLCIGFILPICRSLIFPVPPLYPTAIAMAFELAVYGAAIGMIYSLFKYKNIISLYISLISSMLLGRIVWGGISYILLALNGGVFTFSMFLSGAFVNAVLGIIIQLILIPAIIFSLQHASLLPFTKKENA